MIWENPDHCPNLITIVFPLSLSSMWGWALRGMLQHIVMDYSGSLNPNGFVLWFDFTGEYEKRIILNEKTYSYLMIKTKKIRTKLLIRPYVQKKLK